MNPQPDKLPHHFTASGIVVCDRHVLLVDHKRIGAWVPPGGHIEEDELPEQTVIREILEETSMRVDVLSDPIPESSDPDAFFLALPLYVQSVLAIEGGQRYYHVDLAYLCVPAAGNTLDEHGLPLVVGNSEVKAARWVELSSARQLPLAKNVSQALEKLDDQALLARFVRVAWHCNDIDKQAR